VRGGLQHGDEVERRRESLARLGEQAKLVFELLEVRDVDEDGSKRGRLAVVDANRIADQAENSRARRTAGKSNLTRDAPVYLGASTQVSQEGPFVLERSNGGE
jgi:hypothetical protein